MVYPHSNEIGKEKPKLPAPPEWAFELEAMSEAIMSKSQYAKALAGETLWKDFIFGASYNPPPATQNVSNQTIKELEELIKKAYGFSGYGGPPKKDPVLIDGPKGGYKFFDPSPALPTSMSYKVMRMDIRIDGLPMKDSRIAFQYAMPESEVTESQLRRILQDQFKSVENMIIKNIKKDKGIK